jgi:hypothetical protein
MGRHRDAEVAGHVFAFGLGNNFFDASLYHRQMQPSSDSDHGMTARYTMVGFVL